MAAATKILLARCPVFGIEIEDKKYSLAIHYRLAPDARRAHRTIIRALAKLQPTPQLISGKLVINVFPSGAADKGVRIVTIVTLYAHCGRALFIGDDDTDEAVFALNNPRIVVTVRVGLKRNSRAHYYLRNQGEVDAVLRYLTYSMGAVR